jgi:hypothetical protein
MARPKQTNGGYDLVRFAGERAKHPCGIVLVERLSENLVTHDDNSVSA